MSKGIRREIPEKQAQVYAFILAELAAGRPFPSARAVAERMGWKTSWGANECFQRLKRRGLIEPADDGAARKRRWRITASKAARTRELEPA